MFLGESIRSLSDIRFSVKLSLLRSFAAFLSVSTMTLAHAQYSSGIPTHTTVVIQQPPTLSSHSQQIFCPTCNRPVVTKVNHQSGKLTWLSCCLIFVLGGPFFCCLIPFCCPPCKDVEHKCSDCHRVLGIYRRL
ncbi:lipopolysaccharide induced tumor necrosis [Echinococcus multilocularis]|uniref:Lipopolysaccharide induced tumor necrosis n=1 Tax=Echinococcus multilocularis TaxID=6211 RepID=A0A068XZ06_ECHMU|nr:lipopolysaccharide induced tumor necrosis [Echinococcus multilocularis]